MAGTRLGRVQLRIMKVLWDRGRASAREVTDALNAESPIAHSTVQTLLRKLEDKGAVRHDTDGRTFTYLPVVDESSATRSATRELIERVFGGSAAGLVAYLLKEERIPRGELREIRRLIERKASSEGQGHDSK
jgi:BlaI family penicillinase repressor